MSRFCRISFCRNCSIILYIYRFVIFAINFVEYFVCVDRECTCDSYIISRHLCRYFAPTGECVTCLCRIIFCRNSCIIFYIYRFVIFAIYFVEHFVCVNGECTCDSNIFVRHSCGSCAPT